MGDVCLQPSCVTPGQDCLDSYDCPEGEFCEPTLGACLPQPSGLPVCEYKPEVGPLHPTIEWSWTETAIFPTFVQVINMPVVVDLENDGTPDVVVVTSDSYDPTGGAYLRALDGKTGQEKWGAGADVYSDAGRITFCRTPAVADIDGDKRPDVLVARATGNGALVQISPNSSGMITPILLNGSIGDTPYGLVVADFDGDGAVDAAVAVGFALTVTYPVAGNIGGGGFMVIRMADGRTASIDYREVAPLAASRNMYLDAKGTLTNESIVGYKASGVPGSVAMSASRISGLALWLAACGASTPRLDAIRPVEGDAGGGVQVPPPDPTALGPPDGQPGLSPLDGPRPPQVDAGGGQRQDPYRGHLDGEVADADLDRGIGVGGGGDQMSQ